MDTSDDDACGMERNHYSNDAKHMLVMLHRSGMIFGDLGRRLDTKKTTISRIVRRCIERQSVERKEGSGRPSILTQRDKRAICKAVKANRFITIDDIKIDTGLFDCCNQTIANCIHQELGMRSYYAYKKPFVNETNREKRLAFALEHVHKPLSFWRKAIFVDESPFTFVSRFTERCWRAPGERFNPECTIATLKHDGKINVWGGLSYNGVTKLHQIDGIMNGEMYTEILETVFYPEANRLYSNGNFMLVEDNDPKHTCKVAKQWITTRRVHKLDWPSQSPDLNPIENLWSILDRRCGSRRPNNDEDLFEILKHTWETLPLELLHRLVDSMPDRLTACIESNGWQTKY